MEVTLVAVGKTGEKFCETVLFGCGAGVVPAENIHLVVVGDVDDSLRLAVEQYQTLHQQLKDDEGAFSPAVDVVSIPVMETSLQLMAREEEERLLCKCLFNRDEMGKSFATNMGDTGPVAALAWTQLLEKADTTPLASIKLEAPIILTGSLCEAACAAGVNRLRQWLRHRSLHADVSGLFFLPISRMEDAGLAQETLTTFHEEDWRALTLLGLAEDCRDERENAFHLVHWMGVNALVHQMQGEMGGKTACVMADRLDYQDFGSDAAVWKIAYEGALRTGTALINHFAPTVLDKLESPHGFFDRMGWYGTYYRGIEEHQRETEAAWMRTAVAFYGRFCQHMAEVCEGMPAPMRWAGGLEEAKQQAVDHYELVLELAGQAALLQHDVELGGMAQETFVHRYQHTEFAGEETIRQLEEMREQMEACAAEQEELDLVIGGRAQRTLLLDKIRICHEEAEALRATAEEAKRRIEKAAEIATPEEMPRVETARAKLTRLMRRLAVLDGRTARAEQDYQRSCGEKIRTRIPQATEDMQSAETKPLYSPEYLRQVADCALALGEKGQKGNGKIDTEWLSICQVRAIRESVAKAAVSTDTPFATLMRTVIDHARRSVYAEE